MELGKHWEKILGMLGLLLLAGVFYAEAAEGLADGSHAAAVGLADGSYAVEVGLSGGSGRIHVENPAAMAVEDGHCFVWITWSSPQYDTLRIAEITYDNQSEEGENSCFRIPVPAFDEEIEVFAGTHILGESHEIPYSLQFYADSIGPEERLPQEAAKRVLIMAALIVVVGGILNHFSKRKRRQDYLGKKQ